MSKSNPEPDDRFLLIWNECPDRIKYYAIPRWEVELHAADLNAAHGKMINGDEDVDGACRIGELIDKGFKGPPVTEEGVAYRTGWVDRPEGKWAKYKLYVDELMTHEFVGVYTSGFIL